MPASVTRFFGCWKGGRAEAGCRRPTRRIKNIIQNARLDRAWRSHVTWRGATLARGCAETMTVDEEFGTWHHGLIARHWAEFNVAEPDELAYFQAAIKKFGEPALDLGCGTGRILIPLLAEGFDVDGCDISADMIALAKEQASSRGFKPRLSVQPMHELDLGRRYRTIYMCGVYGIGGRRDYDREALGRAHRHLDPG